MSHFFVLALNGLSVVKDGQKALISLILQKFIKIDFLIADFRYRFADFYKKNRIIEVYL